MIIFLSLFYLYNLISFFNLNKGVWQNPFPANTGVCPGKTSTMDCLDRKCTIPSELVRYKSSIQLSLYYNFSIQQYNNKNDISISKFSI